jgi:hypothetical protein
VGLLRNGVAAENIGETGFMPKATPFLSREGSLDHEGHEKPRNPRKDFVPFVTFREFRVPAFPAREVAG